MITITILMIILIGRVRIGLLSMVPNITPILITIGGMGWFDVPMDLFNMLVGSIAIGLAVDDTIHFKWLSGNRIPSCLKASIKSSLLGGQPFTLTQ